MIGVVLGLGCLLLLIALQAPLLAAVGVLADLLRDRRRVRRREAGVPERRTCTRCWASSPRDASTPRGRVFFFAMIFAISMDYTVFLLSSAKEHWDRTHDPKEAMVGGLAHSGRVIFAAAGAVMVAVFFTFALSG